MRRKRFRIPGWGSMRLTQKLLLVYMPLVTIPAVLGIAAVTWIHGLLYREQMTIQAETVLRSVSEKMDRQFQAYESAMLPYYTDPATLALLEAAPASTLDQYRMQQEAENRYFALMNSRELAWIDAFMLLSRSSSIYTVGDRSAFRLDMATSFVAKIRSNGGAAVWEVAGKDGQAKLIVGRAINRVSGSRFEYLGVLVLVIDPAFLKASLDTETLGAGAEYALLWKDGTRLLDTQSRQTHSLNMLTLSVVDDRYDWQLQLRLPLSFYKEALGTSLLIAFVITLCCLLIGLWVTRMIATDVVLPIRRLSRSMVRGVGNSEPLQLEHFGGAKEIVQLKDTFVSVMAEVRQLNHEILLTQKKRQEATMKALEHRLAPHFLYNTLNTIRWMAIIQQQHNIKDMVDALTRLLSYSIREVDKPVPLREELDVLRDYMKIQTVRYEHHALRVEVPDSLLEQPILKLLIQPLIENAIIHGLSKVERTGEITLTAQIIQGKLEIRIADNGQGMSEEQLIRLRETIADDYDRGKSFGLRSIRERIQLHYGDDYGLTIDSEYGAGTIIVLRLPLLAPF